FGGWVPPFAWAFFGSGTPRSSAGLVLFAVPPIGSGFGGSFGSDAAALFVPSCGPGFGWPGFGASAAIGFFAAPLSAAAGGAVCGLPSPPSGFGSCFACGVPPWVPVFGSFGCSRS